VVRLDIAVLGDISSLVVGQTLKFKKNIQAMMIAYARMSTSTSSLSKPTHTGTVPVLLTCLFHHYMAVVKGSQRSAIF
jgi:hypothetical protein